MAAKQCLLCKEDKSIANYISVKSKLLNGVMPICRKCIANTIAEAKESELWNTVDKLCQLADVPFIPEEFERIYKTNGTDAFGAYCYIFRDKPYDTLDWKMYNEVYLRIQEEGRVEDALPEVKADRENKLRSKWGAEYEISDLEYLENLYQGIVATSGVVGSLNEDQVLKICKISLIIEEKIRAGVDFSKDLKGYDDLCKLAGVTTQSVKDGSEFNSAGEIFAYLEKLGYKVKYYDGAINDEVDKTIKDIQYWIRYLYVNETGVASEIQERIEGLKTADKLTGENFDWGEYRQYVEGIDENEDFEIEI